MPTNNDPENPSTALLTWVKSSKPARQWRGMTPLPQFLLTCAVKVRHSPLLSHPCPTCYTQAIDTLEGTAMSAVAYDEDFYSWTLEQAKLLEHRRFDEIDLEHLVEELHSMSARERRELLSRLRVLLMHLLTWQHQPHYIGRRSWERTIKTQRKEIGFHMEDNPGLKPELGKLIERAYDLALDDAEGETGLSRKQFPAECPWIYEQFMNADFWPEPAG